jgi:hypothetical protein
MSVPTEHVAGATAIRPFRVDIPEEALDDLRRRIAPRWPSRELVADRTQGVQLATVQEPARYWATDYDWRKAEPSSTRCRSSRPRSTGSTSTSSTSARPTSTRCRCS